MIYTYFVKCLKGCPQIFSDLCFNRYSWSSCRKQTILAQFGASFTVTEWILIGLQIGEWQVKQHTKQYNIHIYYVLVHPRRWFHRGVPSQFTEAHLPWTNRPFPESAPHLDELTSTFTESVKFLKYSAQHACMCTHWHVRILCWLYPVEFNQRNRVRSAQYINTGASAAPSGTFNLERSDLNSSTQLIAVPKLHYPSSVATRQNWVESSSFEMVWAVFWGLYTVYYDYVYSYTLSMVVSILTIWERSVFFKLTLTFVLRTDSSAASPPALC